MNELDTLDNTVEEIRKQVNNRAFCDGLEELFCLLRAYDIMKGKYLGVASILDKNNERLEKLELSKAGKELSSRRTKRDLDP